MVEGTVAGLAAAVVARGLVDTAKVCTTRKRLEVYLDGEFQDMALIDLAVSKERFVASRAIWDLETIDEMFLTCAEPTSIGLSSIGAQLRPLSIAGDTGMYVRFGHGGTTVQAPVAPGVVQSVPVAEWRLLAIGEQSEVVFKPCTIALDGERQFPVLPGQRVKVVVSAQGPRVVAIEAALHEAARLGVFTNSQGKP